MLRGRHLRALVCTLLLVPLPPTAVRAQGASAQVRIAAEAAGQTGPPSGAEVELEPLGLMAPTRRARIDGVVTWSVPPGEYRLRVRPTSGSPVERVIDAEPGGLVSVIVRPSADPSAALEVAVESPGTGSYGVLFPRRLLEGLPSSRTVQSLLETAHGFLIADTIDGGGIWTGDPIRLGGYGSSSRQVTYTLAGADLTDPLVLGTPMIFPALGALQAVSAEAAHLDPSAAGPGPLVVMAPKRPSTTWTGDVSVEASPPGLQADAGDIVPIARLESWTDGSVAAGGPLAPSAGLFVAGRVNDARRVEREEPVRLDHDTRAFFAHAVGMGAPGREIGVVASVTDATRPLETRASFADRAQAQRDRQALVSASWQAMRENGAGWTLAADYQRASAAADLTPDAAGGLIERLRDGPPLRLADPVDGARQRWAVRGAFTPAVRRWLGRDHVLRLGASVGAVAATLRLGPQPVFGELVNGRPARVWDIAASGESHRTVTSASAFVDDQILLSDRLTMSAALRLDVDRGSARGAAGDIGWTTASPRAALAWRPSGRDGLVITAGYGWYRHRLPIDALAVGDPAAPTGTMYRWDDEDGNRRFAPSELTAVAAVGTCCTAAGAGVIAEDLRRPTTRAFHIGFEHRWLGWRWGITGLDRREDDLLALVNTGVTPDDFDVTVIDDPGVDIAGLQGFNPLPIYDRQSASFGLDRYALVNTAALPSRYQGLDVSVAREAGDRFYLRFGGSAYRAEGIGASRGYRPDENDQGLLGEVFTTPNAATNARGRLFSDRAFVMKVLGAYTGPGPFRAAAVARYQDGQPFSRLVLAEGVGQGLDVVQAYPRGGQRFTFTATLDARAELRWPLGASRAVSVTLDVFNLLDMANEVEEDIVTGPAFRTITAVQPPRVVRLGVRVTF
ncbi:MAG: TonB-dependent receptor [Vicinamibacterales bacterium]